MNKLTEMVNHKLEEGKLLMVGVQANGTSFVDSVIPELLINNDECLYIEGDNLMLNIPKNKISEVVFDEMEEEYIIKCENMIYSLS